MQILGIASPHASERQVTALLRSGVAFAGVEDQLAARARRSDQKQREAEARSKQQTRTLATSARTVAPVRAAAPKVDMAAERRRLDAAQAEGLRFRSAAREREQTSAAVAKVVGEHDPRAIRLAHEAEGRRLAAVQKQIENDIRTATWRR